MNHAGILETIIPGYWILEEGDMRRKKSKNGEDATDQTYQKKRHPGLKPACVLPLEEQCFNPECSSRGYEKDSDVEPISGGSQDAGIGVVNYRDQYQSQQNPYHLNTPEVSILLSPNTTFYKRKQNHRVVDQLHMFPDGFVHRREESSNYTLTAQVKQEMKKGSQCGGEQKTCHLPMVN